MRTLLFISILLFSTSANATIRISEMDQGGSVDTYLMFWKNIAQTDENVVVDAPCISACTFFLGIIPEDRVCITSRASLGVHEINDGHTSMPAFSSAFYRWLYPIWVQQWIKDHGGLSEEPIYMFPEDVKDHIKLCPGDTYNTVSPDDLIHKEDSSVFTLIPSHG